MVKKKDSKKSKTKEIFEVGNKIIEKESVIEEKIKTKNQIAHQNKILRNFFIGIGIFVLLILGLLLSPLIFNSNFNYAGLDWDVINTEGEITFYHSSFLSTPTNTHNIYLRHDPRKIEEEIPFEGTILLKNLAFIETNSELHCEGYDQISTVLLKEMFEAWGTKLVGVSKGECEKDGEYTFIKLIPGETTKIVEVGPSCYEFYTKNCEIFEVKERFIVEGLLKTNN